MTRREKGRGGPEKEVMFRSQIHREPLQHEAGAFSTMTRPAFFCLRSPHSFLGTGLQAQEAAPIASFDGDFNGLGFFFVFVPEGL